MIDEGYIKFDCNWQQTAPLKSIDISRLNQWRDRLYELGLIGVYDNGIGFGNISELQPGNRFIISGSATGDVEKLDHSHYAQVLDYNIDQNSLECKGPVKASSESLTHASIYKNDSTVRGVIHVHSLKLWEALKFKIPTSQEDVPYGTPEMAYEIDRLFKETDLRTSKILAMAGHEEGIISFGKDLDEAGSVLLQYI